MGRAAEWLATAPLTKMELARAEADEISEKARLAQASEAFLAALREMHPNGPPADAVPSKADRARLRRPLRAGSFTSFAKLCTEA